MSNRIFGKRMIGAVALMLTALTVAGAAVEKPTELTQSCMTGDCHPSAGQHKVLHGPLAQDACMQCHVSKDAAAHTFTLVADGGPEMCQKCHEMAGRSETVNVHKPVDESCLSCHAPHGSETTAMLRADSLETSCDNCHPDVTNGMSVVHGPVGAKSCLACHEAHWSEHANLLLAPTSELCFICHQEQKDAMMNAVSSHQAVVEEGCLGCHSSHASSHEYLLSAEPNEQCRQCHAAFIDDLGKKKFSHEPLVEGEQCMNCHDPHFSEQSDLLRQISQDLCLGCHDKEIQIKTDANKTRALSNIKQQLAENPNHHGPVREGNCSACHMAHGSDFISLLIQDFPERFYANWSENTYEACFECHDRRLVDDHPTQTTTAFRNGDQNLHYLHTRRKKGRTCRACHAEHASKQPHLIRESVPFGSWELKNDFTKTDTGGGCLTGCHVTKNYDRDNPIKYDAKS